MGACCSPGVERQLSAVINDEIKHDKNKGGKVKKILFLGSGGSGKSTLFKQLRLIHGKGFNANDKEEYIKHIHTQIIDQMKAVIRIYIDYNLRIKQREKKLKNGNSDHKENNYNLNVNNGYDKEEEEEDELLIFDEIELKCEELKNTKEAEMVLNYQYDKNKHCLEEDIATSIKLLWTEPVIKEIYDLRNITKIETSSKYFWDKLDEIQDSNYLPSNQDILLCRLKTTG